MGRIQMRRNVVPRVGTKPARRPGATAKRSQFARTPVSLPVTGRAPQLPGTRLRGIVRSLGIGSMLVEFPVEVLPGSLLRVTVQTALGPLELEGRVVWTTATGRVIRHGLAFPRAKTPQGIKKSSDL